MIKGLAWGMGRGAEPEQIAAVVGNRMMTRAADRTWRASTFGQAEHVDAAAVRWTKEREDQGLRLVMGPVVFTSYSDSAKLDKWMKAAILKALYEPIDGGPKKYASIDRTASGRWKEVL